MAHKPMVNGTTYEVDKGKPLVEGTAYEVSKGKSLVEGTVHEIGFAPPLTATLTQKYASIYANAGIYYMSGGKRIELSEVGIYEIPAGTKMYVYVEYISQGSTSFYVNIMVKGLGSTSYSGVSSTYMSAVGNTHVYEFVLNTSIKFYASVAYSSAYVYIDEIEGNMSYVQSISVTTPPSKTTYAAGGKAFDSTGMVVTATYENGTTADVTGYTVLNGDQIAANMTDVQISYTELGKTVTTTYKVNVVTSGVLSDGEIADSWSVIKAKTNIGSYAIGNIKVVTLSDGTKVNMEIIAFGLDTTPSGSIAAITWMAKKSVEHMKMYSDKSTQITWLECAARSYLQGDFYNTLHNDVKDAIVTVMKTYYNAYTGATLTCSDNIWIPSGREMYTGITCEASGAIYSDRFPDVESRKGRGDFWLRTTYNPNNGACYFYTGMNSGGRSGRLQGGGNAANYGVLPCFCT